MANYRARRLLKPTYCVHHGDPRNVNIPGVGGLDAVHDAFPDCRQTSLLVSWDVLRRNVDNAARILQVAIA